MESGEAERLGSQEAGMIVFAGYTFLLNDFPVFRCA
jgi:hypothetical protein